MGFFGTWLATTIATMVAISVVPGIYPQGGNWGAAIMTALALAFVNALVKPVLMFFSLPINLFTLGLFTFVINALMLELAGTLARNVLGAGIVITSFGSALIGSIIISLVTSIVVSLLS